MRKVLTRDAAMLLGLLNESLPPKFIEGRRYQLRLNKRFIQRNTLEHKIVEEWWKALQGLCKDSGAIFDETIKFNRGDRRKWLIHMECHKAETNAANGAPGSGILIGESYVGVKHLNAPHKLIGLLNIAFAASNIEEDVSRWNGEYTAIVEFINKQHAMLTGKAEPLIKEEDPQEIIKRIREKENIREKGLYIELPPVRKVDYDRERLLLMAKEALKAV